MMSEKLIGLLDEFQKFAVKLKIQQILDTLVKDDRVHEVIDADKVFDYHNKMREHFTKNPQDFTFSNREWVQESLKRINVDVSDIFDAGANVDHIKREEIIILFMLLWIHMKIQDPSSSSSIEDPYILFHYWIYDRVIVTRPTKEAYLSHEDEKVLDRASDKYGLFINLHHFSINEKGEVDYWYTDPSNIINLDSCVKCGAESFRKVKDLAMSRLTKEQNKLADADKKHWTEADEVRARFQSKFRYMKGGRIKFGHSEKKTPIIWHHNIEEVLVKVPKDIHERIPDIDFDNFEDTIGKLTNDLLAEKQRHHNIARNTKFVVRKMTTMSNKDYKAFLKKFKEREVMRCYDWFQCFDDILKISDLEFDNEVILEAAVQYNRSIYHLNKALLKLKEKLNEEKDQ
jgi:hypothetical protein